MRTLQQLEIEVREYTLGLAGISTELGAKAVKLFDQFRVRQLRPLLMKQRAIIKQQHSIHDCEWEAGEVWTSPTPEQAERINQLSLKFLEIEKQVIAEWENCLEQLQQLWLKEAPQEEAS